MSGSVFDREEFQPYVREWRARQLHFARLRSYYDGSVYADVQGQLAWLAARLAGPIRPIYLPLARAVNLDAGLVPGGWRLKDADAPLQAAVARVLGWSQWATEGVLYVRNGAILGHSGLKVSDLREQRRVVVKPVSPERFMLVPASPCDPTPALALVVEARRGPSGNPFEYAEVITPSAVRTFANGEPMGFDGRYAQYRNALGFVPFVEVRHIETGLLFGECTFENVTRLLDGVNQLATDLGDMIKRHTKPQWVVLGAEDSNNGRLSRGGDNVWFVPEGGDVKAMVAAIDVKGVLDYVREARDGVYAGLPELAFDELRKKDTVATATVELQLKELTVKIALVRPNYDEGFVQALRMAGRAAASIARDDAAFGTPVRPSLLDVAELDTDDLALDPDREIIPMDPLTRAQIELHMAQAARARA